MAEGFLKTFDEEMVVRSAGVEPAMQVSNHAILLMDQIGVDIGFHQPEDVRDYIDQDFDYVITVSDHALQSLPKFTGKIGERLHYSFDDPYMTIGTEEEIMAKYLEVRNEIHENMLEFYLKKVLDFNSKIDLTLQHFEGCPNSPAMIENISQVVRFMDKYVDYKEQLIENDAAAKMHKFRGSPTLLINGIDYENMPEPENPGMTCRFYPGGVPEPVNIEKRMLDVVRAGM